MKLTVAAFALPHGWHPVRYRRRSLAHFLYPAAFSDAVAACLLEIGHAGLRELAEACGQLYGSVTVGKVLLIPDFLLIPNFLANAGHAPLFW